MDTGPVPPAEPIEPINLGRAGFWRRWLATLIDTIVVLVPCQILAAVLFSATAGMIQMDGGIFRYCASVQQIPPSLIPPPPHDSNFANVCKFSLFGMPNGAVLTVGRSTREGNTTTNITQGYMLDQDGKPIHGVAIDGIVWAALVAYLVIMIWRNGRSLGDRAMKLRVIDTDAPAARQIPIAKVVIRFLAMTIGFVPAGALLIARLGATDGSADAIFTAEFFRWLIAALGFAGLWTVVQIVLVAMKKDPVYDRLAGTAVVRA
jgi:uncharacterized RDD family membrane protein YckC